MENLSLIERSKVYILQNIDKKISTKDICSHLNISSTYLIKCFKKETGLTPHDFILFTKVLKAKELIDSGDDISAIAQDIGFFDQSHLNRVFKRYEDVTPYEYKKLMRLEKVKEIY